MFDFGEHCLSPAECAATSEEAHNVPEPKLSLNGGHMMQDEGLHAADPSLIGDFSSRNRLRIDFARLEALIVSERAERCAQSQADLNLQPSLVQVEISNRVSASPTPRTKSIEGAGTEKVREFAGQASKGNATASPRCMFYSLTGEATINAHSFGDLILDNEEVRTLFTSSGGEGNNRWWLDIANPTDEQTRAICEAFGVHPLTTEDILTQETREKVAIFPSYYFVDFQSFYTIRNDNGGDDYEPFGVYMVVFPEGIISFCYRSHVHSQRVRNRIAILKDQESLNSDWICYALIDNIVDSFAPEIHDIELISEGIEEAVITSRPDDRHTFLRHLGAARKKSLSHMRLLRGKADVLRGLAKRCTNVSSGTLRIDMAIYFGDIIDHVVTMESNLLHFEKMLSRAYSNYLAQLTVDGITEGTKTNNTLAKITFLGSVFVPLNLISSLFGMNVKVPWQGEDSLVPFYGIVGVLLVFPIVAFLITRRARYL
ncbi:CorA-like Mg2+ transporter [Colletotrichum truncatum]|uniref:CorA-like Mg2+ transporter n=1 Tax=Colletotrichum truncatum TaxID=5467 RepID=A0ACC3YZ28_COLTU|nr:CorA-like Mg2+ transporter [Colletotrichum truncatum]KAF6786319.1 CorA-like Mg2+ transporter [Colletotrichum truncatum]